MTQVGSRCGCFLPDLTGLARNLSTASLPNKLYQVPARESQARITRVAESWGTGHGWPR